jgi:hypothetical protein
MLWSIKMGSGGFAADSSSHTRRGHEGAQAKGSKQSSTRGAQAPQARGANPDATRAEGEEGWGDLSHE